MGKIFDLDSPIMRALSKMADVMWLNILTLIFATPLILEQLFFLSPVLFGDFNFEVSFVFWAWILGIVFSIPLGPALTAMHYVLLKIVRDEDSYVTKSYFKSLKENLGTSYVLLSSVIIAIALPCLIKFSVPSLDVFASTRSGL